MNHLDYATVRRTNKPMSARFSIRDTYDREIPSSFAISRCVRSSPPSSNPNRPTTTSFSRSSNISKFRYIFALLYLQLHRIHHIVRLLPRMSINVISFPSLSVPMGSCKDTSFRVFFNERRCIRISFSIQRAAKVANFVPLFGEKDSIALINPIVPIEIKSSKSSPVLSNFLRL